MPGSRTTLRLQPTTRAATLARQAVRACGSKWPAARLHAALTVVSELVTNAVVHGDGLVTVAIDSHSGAVAIAVSDDGPRGVMRLNHAPDAETGRGLVVVEGLASAWGVRPSAGGHGKTVWARIGDISPHGSDRS